MDVTPELASKWLAASEGNPRWKRTGKVVDNMLVSKIADDIRSGNWNPGNNSIAFDKNGVLKDGHHRCAGIVKAGITVKSIVVFDMEDKGIQHIDENHVRSVSQRTGICMPIVAAVNCHFWMSKSMTKSSESSEVVQKWVELHPDVYIAFDMVKQGARHPITQKAGVIHGLTCAIEYGLPKDKL